MEFGIWDLGFELWDLGFGIWNLQILYYYLAKCANALFDSAIL
jgi:hypothetical protein